MDQNTGQISETTLIEFEVKKDSELDKENGNKHAQESKTTTTTRNDNDTKHGSGRTRCHLVQSVSIIVEPVFDMMDDDDDSYSNFNEQSMSSKDKMSPIVLLDDINFDQPRKTSVDDEFVESIIATARVRQEEFARLLEEHAEIVHEINRVETSLL